MASTTLDIVDLGDLVFDNRFTDELPADPSTEVRPRQVHHAAYSRVQPTPTEKPTLIAHSREMADLLGFSEDTVRSDEFAAVFSGNALTEGMDPYAMAYAGHQFGNWAGQLGDGRAIALGELIGTDGNHHMLQLKGGDQVAF